MEFHKNLKLYRKQLGLTQEELAKLLGVAKTTYSSYEQGARMPDIETQKSLSILFGVGLDTLHSFDLNLNQNTISLHMIKGFSTLDFETQEKIKNQLINQGKFMVDLIKNKEEAIQNEKRI